MNIYLHEIKRGLKPFLFWMLGISALIFASVTKYQGIRGEAAAQTAQLLKMFPKVILATFGMVGIDISQFSGYYTVVGFLVMICLALYATMLGSGVVLNETFDNTSEFIFAKPRTRFYILTSKFAAAESFLIGSAFITYLVSIAAQSSLKLEVTASAVILRYSLAILIVSLIFLYLSAATAASVRLSERGKSFSVLVFLSTFIFSFLYDILDNVGFLRYFTPFKYFSAAEIISGSVKTRFILLAIMLVIAGYWLTISLFRTRDVLD